MYNEQLNLLNKEIHVFEHFSKIFQLQKAEIKNNRLIFEHEIGFDQAIKDGFFLLKKPQDLDLEPGIKISKNFYKIKSKEKNYCNYSGYKNYEGIYFDREHFQTEHILLDKPNRIRYFPYELQTLTNKMNDIAIIILKNIFDKIKIPKQDWNKITGGAIDNQGNHWFSSSHYRSYMEKQGCATHKDTGFVTVLYINEEGLEANINDEWISVRPQPGYFVINFGHSLEILTAKMTIPIKAILHRVKKIKKQHGKEDRYSFATFINTQTHMNLYQYDEFGNLNFYQTVEDYLYEFNKKAWNDKYSDFGLK
jgi:hypothetical protein